MITYYLNDMCFEILQLLACFPFETNAKQQRSHYEEVAVPQVPPALLSTECYIYKHNVIVIYIYISRLRIPFSKCILASFFVLEVLL